jgi:hypothetical protein
MGRARRNARGRQAPHCGRFAGVAALANGAISAFLVYENFRIYLQWNNALVYSTTAAYLASRIAGAPPLRRGNPPAPLAFNDVKALQTILSHAGYDVGKIDGFLGLKTRQAVKAMQMKYGLPADSYPTAELLARMRTSY